MNYLYIPPTLLCRIAALVYDLFVIVSFLFLATALALLVNGGKSLSNYTFIFLPYLIISTGLFLAWCWSYRCRTLGMLAWRMLILDDNLKPIKFKTAFYRYLLAIPSVGLCGIGLIWSLFDKEDKSLHDRLAGTKLVVMKPKHS